MQNGSVSLMTPYRDQPLPSNLNNQRFVVNIQICGVLCFFMVQNHILSGSNICEAICSLLSDVVLILTI